MSQLENALRALRLGLKVFPCHPRSKKPAGEVVPNGAKDATTDEMQLHRWWGKNPDYNPGVTGGTIVDCDKGLNSLEEALRFAKLNGFPPTLAVRTGRRDSYGVQFHFSGQAARSGPYEVNGVSGEVRAGNLYGMAPGAVHPDTGEAYEIVVDRPLASCPPDVLVKAIEAVRRRNVERVERGEKITHPGRHDWLVSQAGRLFNIGLTGGDLFNALNAFDQKNCSPPKGPEHVRGIVADAERLWEKKKDVASPIIIKAEELQRPDMPASVLCGRLGEICRSRLSGFPIAYSWLSILAAASTLVKPAPEKWHRCNLNVALVGPSHSGKSEAQEHANYQLNLGLEEGLAITEKFGSAEGMMEHIGDRGGSPVIWAPDELSHLLAKAQIQGASFPYVLNTLFYNDRNNSTVQHRKHIKFNARVSIAGGVVEDNFGDSFGAATTTGLYDRFLMGLCPSNFQYLYRPPEGRPEVEAEYVGPNSTELPFTGENAKVAQLPRFDTPTIHSEVWEAKDEMIKAEKINPRIVELCLRTALICAAWDEKKELRASDLQPAWELARYQQRVRAILQPNPGRNFEAIAAIKILTYVQQHADGERWLAWRDVYRGTHVREFGPSVAERAMNALVFAGDLEKVIINPPNGGKGKILVRVSE